jgi:cytosine/adenosine deaminase-related metal-dependent hydrolase
VHSIKFGEVELIEHAAIIYNSQGVIEQVLDLEKQPELRTKLSSLFELDEVLDYGSKLLIPGFVDAHCHAPQYVFSGTGMDLPLLAWLEKYTFPCEARFSDLAFAREAYEKSIKRHLKCGTTFASYFATIHTDACKVLVDVIGQVGQRAHVGKVNMDRNCPDFYIEETMKGCDATEHFIQHVLSLTTEGRSFLASKGVAIAPPLSTSVSMPNLASHYETEGNSSSNKRSRTISMGSVPDELCSSDIHANRPRSISAASTIMDEELDAYVPLERGRSSSDATFSYGAMEAASTRPKRSYAEPSPGRSSSYRNLDVLDQSVHSTTSTVASWDLPEGLIMEHTLLDKATTPLVMPCVTPRFVPTCTAGMMARLGDLSQRYGLPVQSHMSESVSEIAWVAELHPDCASYAAVYEQHGLLHNKVYMAHCCHSSAEERAMLQRTGASVVHCASSNFMLSSGVMDVRGFLQDGVKVALGTDVAGGYSPSMLDALRQTVVASRVKGFDYRVYLPPADSPDSELAEVVEAAADAAAAVVAGAAEVAAGCATTGASSLSPTPQVRPGLGSTPPPSEPYRCLSYLEAFHLATVGGAEVLGMGSVLGNFLPGKKLDCLVVDVHVPSSPIDTFGHETSFELFQKFLFLGDDRNIQHVFVDGRKVI